MTGDGDGLSAPGLAGTWMAMQVHWHGYRVPALRPGAGCWLDAGELDAVLFTPTEVADWLTDSTGVVAVRPGVRHVGNRGPVQCFDWPLDLTLHANNEVIASRAESVHHSYLTDEGGHVHLIAQVVTDQHCQLHPVAVDLTTVDHAPTP